jgi:hypothetical protein
MFDDLTRHLKAPVRVLARRGFIACAQAVFPEGHGDNPDWRATALADRFDPWLDALPPETRGLMEAVFTTIELGGGLLGASPGPFSRLPVARRAALISGWRASHFMPLRFLGDAIKSSTGMLYMSHPAALRRVGARSACDHPENAAAGVVRVPFPSILRKPAADPGSTP